jgi:hypothetical protein
MDEWKRTSSRFRPYFRLLSIQTLLLPVVALAQLGYLTLASIHLPQADYSRALIIISLTGILAFLDFGLLNVYYFTLINAQDNQNDSRITIRTLMIYSRIVAIMEVSTGAILSVLDGVTPIALFLIFNGLNLPAMLNLVSTRVHRGNLTYLIVFHLSWPLALLFQGLVLFFCSEEDFARFAPYLPWISSLTLNYSWILANRFLGKNRQRSERSSQKVELFNRPLLSALLSSMGGVLTLGICLHLDKFFASTFLAPEKLSSFLSGATIYTSVMGVSWFIYMSTSREIRRSNPTKSDTYPVLLLSFLLIIVFLLCSLLLRYISGESINLHVTHLIYFSGLIILGNLSHHYQSLLFLDGRFSARLKGQLIQISIFCFLVFFIRQSKNEILFLLSNLTAYFCYFLYLRLNLQRKYASALQI